MTTPAPFLLGHGTGNDFVLLPDHDASRYGAGIDPGLARLLSDRRRGLGGDGVIRVVRTAALAAAGGDTSAGDNGAEWFMDYVNADGSVAEMCGNGIRVLARHLLEAGLVPATSPLLIDTRAGVHTLTVGADGTVTVDMGRPGIGSGDSVRVRLAAVDATGTVVTIPNPHAVVPVRRLRELGRLDGPPVFSPAAALPSGANVELVVRTAPQHVSMRVWERGVGETQSCGTGVCAAAWVAMRDDGAPPGATYRVDVPGGTLQVTQREDGHLLLRGPAVVVAQGEVHLDRLDAAPRISDDATR
jgi:diaminopimelate epimerase